MAILAVVSSPNSAAAPDSTPRRIVTELRDLEIDVVQFKRRNPMAITYFWAVGVRADRVESVLRDDGSIAAIRRIDQTEDGAYFRAVWQVDSPLIRCIEETGGVVVEAQGTVDRWQLEVWFEDRGDASAFQDCCRDRDIPLEVKRLSSPAASRSETDGTLTERQREALILAHREGYFDEPRALSQAELGDLLDISSSAVGRRLRRGIDNLVEDVLIE